MAEDSANKCMQAFGPIGGFCSQYDGFVVACYSLHPLVDRLKEHTRKPVVGIFEASITVCLHMLSASQTFGIVSTGAIWETLLTDGVSKVLGVPNGGERFAGVATTGLSAIELHETSDVTVQGLMKGAIKTLLQKRDDIRAICLGCAAMVDLQVAVREGCIEYLGEEKGSQIRIIDGVAAATALLVGLVRLP